MEGAASRLFRPMYAEANIGHPSKTIDRVLLIESLKYRYKFEIP